MMRTLIVRLARLGFNRPHGTDSPDVPEGFSYRSSDAAVDYASRPRQGALGDCWIMAPLLAIHDVRPSFISRMLRENQNGCDVSIFAPTVLSRLGLRPARRCVVHVRREFPVGAAGRWAFARESRSGRPGWPGIVEKAVAAQSVGAYRFIAIGFASEGFQRLTGIRARTHVLIPPAWRLSQLLARGHPIAASTHPLTPVLSRVLRGPHDGALPANHVMAVVGADPFTGEVQVRNPWQPDVIVRINRRTFRACFISVDILSRPLPE